nr:uncharacterized protein LOC110000228 [Labrus bergylta]
MEVYVYLCKEEIGFDKKVQKQDLHDTTFIIQRVNRHDSGNYSCVYSFKNDLTNQATTRGHNIIEILVIANFLPGDISVVGASTVNEGDYVEFRCTLSVTLQTIRECQLIHSYLWRNDSILQVQTFNVSKMEATFTIQGAAMRDSGHYSCVVLPSTCIKKHEEIYGNNAVILEVEGSLFFRVLISAGVISLIVSLGLGFCLGLWWINKQGSASASCNLSAQIQQADSNMWEIQQEQQAEADNMETQDDESFSTEEEEEQQHYQNGIVAEEADILDPEEYEDLYSVADEGPLRLDLYSTSIKLNKCQPY